MLVACHIQALEERTRLGIGRVSRHVADTCVDVASWARNVAAEAPDVPPRPERAGAIAPPMKATDRSPDLRTWLNALCLMASCSIDSASSSRSSLRRKRYACSACVAFQFDTWMHNDHEVDPSGCQVLGADVPGDAAEDHGAAADAPGNSFMPSRR
jgi:hypothetical protein